MPESGDLVMVEEIDPEDWHVREVYARFGLAMYQGQVLEHEIVNLLSWTGINAGEIANREQADASSAILFAKTMGALRAALMTRRIDLGQLDGELTRAVRLRNFLAHHYFRERAAAFMTREGRDGMIGELDQAITFFREVDERLTPFTLRIIEAFGLTGKLHELRAEDQAGKSFGPRLPGLAP